MNIRQTFASTAAIAGVLIAAPAIAVASQVNTNTSNDSNIVKTSAGNKIVTITVQPGDTVSQLAEKHNTTIQNIAQLNNLDSSYTIIAGQKLKIKSQQSQTNTSQFDNSQQGASTYQAGQSAYSSRTVEQYHPLTPAFNGSYSNSETNSYSSTGTMTEDSAKAWIVARESGGNYNAQNGQYIGKYQLSASYLGGDYSPENQERVANQYVANRYGTWTNAQQHWMMYNWY